MSGPAPVRRAVDASMTLLNEIIERPLDAGYAEVAARRAAGGSAPVRVHVRALAAGTAIVLGITAGAAVAALRAPNPDASRAAKTLIADAETRQRSVAELTDENRELTRAVEALEHDLLAGIDPAAAHTAALVGIAAGVSAVRGPGLVVTMAEDPAAIEAKGEAARIRAVDLQTVVNGLWRSGAEAIAINDVRLTTTSPIATAGQAIHIDLTPVTPPYRIEAIGDGKVLEIKLTRTSGGDRMAYLRNEFGVRIDQSVRPDLTLGAASGRAALYFAQTPDLAVTPEEGGIP
ncbi:MAG: DUF881 domain-containing protein [Bifidobacteriaceae bacterium]|jgi:uncharacterized protein YlxW (UPF0749 family)|nr:DUF881 domain-containing protein [Bifidobacteriaceae bacterium]